MKTSALVVVSSSVMGEKCEKSALVTLFTWGGGEDGGAKILGPVVHYWDCHEKIRDHSKTNNRRASTCQSCHLFEVNAAAAISIIKSKSPGQFLVVGPLPADTNCQQPFPDKDKYVINTLNIRKNDSETWSWFCRSCWCPTHWIQALASFRFACVTEAVLQEYVERPLLPDFSKQSRGCPEKIDQ